MTYLLPAGLGMATLGSLMIALLSNGWSARACAWAILALPSYAAARVIWRAVIEHRW